MLALSRPRSVATLLRQLECASAAPRIPSNNAVPSRTSLVRFASETTHNRPRSTVLQWRWLSTSPSRDDDSAPQPPKKKEKLTPAALRQKIKEDVDRAKELVAADVERAKDLALHQVLNVPNMITFARILATPYLGYLIWDGAYTPAVGVLAVAGFSDWLDGFIARRYKQESIVGSFLDPFADKLLIGTLSISMLSSGLLPWPLVVLVFGRDVLLVSGTFYHRLKTKASDSAFFDTTDSGAFSVEPSLLSKTNTALQFAMFGLALTNAAWQMPGDPALNVLFGVVGTSTFLSGSEYMWSYINKTGAFRPLPTSTTSEPTKQQNKTKI